MPGVEGMRGPGLLHQLQDVTYRFPTPLSLLRLGSLLGQGLDLGVRSRHGRADRTVGQRFGLGDGVHDHVIVIGGGLDHRDHWRGGNFGCFGTSLVRPAALRTRNTDHRPTGTVSPQAQALGRTASKRKRKRAARRVEGTRERVRGERVT